MAKQEKEEVVFQFKIEQGDALTEMERFKKLLIQTKEEQKQLNDAYKKGNITLDEFVKEQTRLEAILKKNQSSYNNIQKSVTGVKTQLDKLIDSNKKISKSFQDTANQINVAGVNIGSLTTRLASFANPATAAVGIVGLLGTAYAKSTIGAKDLEFAQSQLTSAISISTNAFAGLISTAEDGGGLLSQLSSEFIRRFFGSVTQAKALAAAFNAETLGDLGRTEIEIRDKVNQRLEENLELLTQMQSDQINLNDKLDKGNSIITNIRRSEEELTDVLGDQLGILQASLNLDKENESLQTAILLKKKEIGSVERDAEKRVQAIVRLQQNLNDAEGKRLKAISDTFKGVNQTIDLLSSTVTPGSIAGSTPREKKKPDSQIKEGTLATVDSAKVSADAIAKINSDLTSSQAREAETRIGIQENEDAVKLQSAASLAAGIAGLFEQGSALQRAFALISIGIDTATALTKGISSSQNMPFPANLAAMATTIAAVLSNIASAKQYLSAAAGGGDFVTKGPALMLVGDNPGGAERVTVEPLSGKGKTVVHPNSNLIAMAGGGTIRAGDGGMLANSITQETNSNLIQANAIKRMPRPELSVKEVTKKQDRIRSRERTSKRLI